MQINSYNGLVGIPDLIMPYPTGNTTQHNTLIHIHGCNEPGWNAGSNLMFVGVIWFVFHVLQLIPIRFTKQNTCCISKRIIYKSRIENWTSLDLVMIIEITCLMMIS